MEENNNKMSALDYIYKVYLENMELDYGHEVLKEEFKNVINVCSFNINHDCNKKVVSIYSTNITYANDMDSYETGKAFALMMIHFKPLLLVRRICFKIICLMV